MNAVEPVIGLQNQEYLTFAKAAILMGCSRQYVYKLVNEGKGVFAAVRLQVSERGETGGIKDQQSYGFYPQS